MFNFCLIFVGPQLLSKCIYECVFLVLIHLKINGFAHKLQPGRIRECLNECRKFVLNQSEKESYSFLVQSLEESLFESGTICLKFLEGDPFNVLNRLC
jgi:hypothetical protein